MPQQREAALCRFCKHFRIETLYTTSPKCDAYPDKIPDAIIRSWKFDHREPYHDDNDIQFERETDESELKKRFPRIPEKRMEEMIEHGLTMTINRLNRGRQSGVTQPPPLNGISNQSNDLE